MATIHIPTTMRRFTDGERSFEVEAENVGSLLSALVDRYPELDGEIRNQEGDLKQFIAIFVNDTDLRNLDSMETSLTARDEVHIIPAMAGG